MLDPYQKSLLYRLPGPQRICIGIGGIGGIGIISGIGNRQSSIINRYCHIIIVANECYDMLAPALHGYGYGSCFMVYGRVCSVMTLQPVWNSIGSKRSRRCFSSWDMDIMAMSPHGQPRAIECPVVSILSTILTLIT